MKKIILNSGIFMPDFHANDYKKYAKRLKKLLKTIPVEKILLVGDIIR